MATVYKFPGSVNTSGTGDFKFLNQAASASDKLAAEAAAAARIAVTNAPNGPPIPNSVQQISQLAVKGGQPRG